MCGLRGGRINWNEGWWNLVGQRPTLRTEAYKVKLTNDTNFVRVYTDDGQHGLYGGFIMLEDDIVGLTADEIQNIYALDFKPKFVADVKLKAGDEIRFSVTNENYGFFGGAIQIDMIDQRIGSFDYKCKIEELVPNGN